MLLASSAQWKALLDVPLINGGPGGNVAVIGTQHVRGEHDFFGVAQPPTLRGNWSTISRFSGL